MFLGYSTLFGRAPSPITRSWLQARTSGARVEDAAHEVAGELKLLVTWSEDHQLELIVRSPDIEELLAAFEEADGDSARAIAQLRAAVTEVRLASSTPLQKGTPAEGLLRFLRTELDAIELRYGCVYDAPGNLLVELSTEEDENERPTPERVRRRAQVLAAVVARAHIENGPARKTALADLWDWLDRHGLWSEAEAGETEFLRTSVGLLERREVIDATWRSEGLVVMLWALGLVDLPPHDEQADTTLLVRTVGLFDKTIPLRLERAQLHPESEIDRIGGRLLGLHWRMRDFSLRPVAFDFEAFSRVCWFGSFDISGIPTIETDLAIGGKPIAKADADQVRIASSIALERHKAINWLHGYGEIYSEVDTST